MKNVKTASQDNTNDLLKDLSLKEKIALCSGKNEWETKEIKDKDGNIRIPSVRVSDGPHGLRKTVGEGDNLGLAASEPATCFPSESLLACSFDEELALEMGRAIAEEAKAAGVCTVLGPGVNIKRNPLCGRNFEYLSEDPFLAGHLAASYIEGVQSERIGCSLKHFACNSQEYYRMTSNSIVDERTLREIYLSAFEYAVKQAKPATVMCAYNKINGISCSDNEFLLNTILREEWDYQGMVVSDWGALNNRIRAFQAGCDLIMPGGSAYEETDAYEAVNSGTLEERFVDRSASRVARFAQKYNEAIQNEPTYAPDSVHVRQLHNRSHKTAQRIAEDSAVLLKNDRKILPITENDQKICVIGSMAKVFRFQGSGSSKINPAKTEDFLKLMESRYGERVSYYGGYTESGETNEEMLKEAAEKAASADKVIIIAGLPEQYEAEGIDRRNMTLPEGQNRLIETIAKVNANVAVVLICGCVVETPWEPRIESILWMGLPGQAGPSALVNLLSGEKNPSGRLAESWPIRYEDSISSNWYLKQRDAEYKEGIYVGYRYYDKAEVPVRFAFGQGLSYTEFAYSDLSVRKEEIGYSVSITVTNTGDAEGKHTVLLYIQPPQDGIHRPIRELKGFRKVHLKPGESREVKILLDDRSFSVWDGDWKTYSGEYTVSIGECKEQVRINGVLPQTEEQSDLAWYQRLKGEFPDAQWENKVPNSEESLSNEKYTVNSTLSEIADDVVLLKIIYAWFEKKQAKLYGKDSAAYLSAMSSANECPLRTIQNFLGLKHHFAQAIADFGNGHPLQGIKHFVK